MGRYNASLSYTPSGRATQTLELWIMNYAQPHTASGTAQQSKMYKHFYPSNYAPGALTVNGNVRTQDDYNNLAEFIRTHHEVLVNSSGQTNVGISGLPLINFLIPSEGLNLIGFVQNFKAGAQRFNPAPPFTFDFFITTDANSANDKIVPAYALRSMINGDFVDEGSLTLGALTIPAPTTTSTTKTPITSPTPNIGKMLWDWLDSTGPGDPIG